jgi:hypothetical protein
VIGVGDEREWEIVSLLELLMRFHGVGADTDDFCIDSLEPREGVAELARLEGSARGGVLRIEVQYDGLAAECRELQRRAGVSGGGEIRGFVAFVEHGGWEDGAVK